MNSGQPTNNELWELFWKWEKITDFASADYRLGAATMAAAIAKIIAARGR